MRIIAYFHVHVYVYIFTRILNYLYQIRVIDFSGRLKVMIQKIMTTYFRHT